MLSQNFISGNNLAIANEVHSKLASTLHIVLVVCYTYAGVPSAAWFTAGDPPKEDLHLRLQQLHILATQDLGNTIPQDTSCDDQRLQSIESKEGNIIIRDVQACSRQHNTGLKAKNEHK